MNIVPEVSHALEVRSAQDSPNNGRSDKSLMQAVCQGSQDALEELYDRHVPQCFGLAMRVVQEPSLAEDIVQEVFTKLWSRPEIFSPERGAFHTWLLTVVRNQGLDKLRRLKSKPTVSMLTLQIEGGETDDHILVDMLPDSSPTPHDQACANEIALAVRHALRQLPAPEYRAITLAYFGGLTQQEVAYELNLPLGTVKTRTRSALRRLHQVLADQSALSE